MITQVHTSSTSVHVRLSKYPCDLPKRQRLGRQLIKIKAVQEDRTSSKSLKEHFKTALDVTKTALVAAVLVTGLGAGSPILELHHQTARADDEGFLSPYEKRRLELQRRRDLLNAAREKALAQGSSEGVQATKTAEEEAANAEVVDANKTREDEAERMRERMKAALQQYEERTRNAPKVVQPSPPNWLSNLSKPAEEATEAPEVKEAEAAPQKAPSFSFSLPQLEAPKIEVPKLEAPTVEVPKFEAPKFDLPKFEAPKFELPKVEAPKPEPPKVVAPPPAAPAAPEVDSGFWTSLKSLTETPEAVKPAEPLKVEKSAPKVEVKPEVKPAPKPEVKPAAAVKKEEVKGKKRKGPLPLWLAEILLLASVGGLLYASLKFEKEIAAFLKTTGDAAESLYERVFPTPKY